MVAQQQGAALTTFASEASPRSPLVSIWLRPRQTIEAVLATGRRPHLVLLVALWVAASLVIQAMSLGLFRYPLPGWAWITLAFVGIVLSIVFLWLWCVFCRWAGRLLGGTASTPDFLAAAAWSAVPFITGTIVALALLASSKLFAGASAAPQSWLRLLVAAIMIACSLWSLVILLFMISRLLGFGFWKTIVTWIVASVLELSAVWLLVLVNRTFAFQPYVVGASSMAPTLLTGDNFFVSKSAYGYGRYSFPFSLGDMSGRILAASPQRGDVVAFYLPRNDRSVYVKRIVGLPGDRIQLMDARLYINGKEVQREALPPYRISDASGVIDVPRYRETLPSGVSYDIVQKDGDTGYWSSTPVYTVPAGEFFVLGDNRDNSQDSRVSSEFGYVPFENLIGKAGLIYDAPASSAGEGSARIGTMVR